MDEQDRELVRLLRLNARATNSSLATAVGLSASATLRRIKILEEKGVIQGYTAIIDAVGEGRGVDVIVQVTLDRQTAEYLSRFESAVRKQPEIRECFLMTGVSDYWLRVNVTTAGAYEAIHTEILSRLPGVTRIQSSFALRDAMRPRIK
jgi:DNA-binding Lrp family transcriptional regulator